MPRVFHQENGKGGMCPLNSSDACQMAPVCHHMIKQGHVTHEDLRKHESAPKPIAGEDSENFSDAPFDKINQLRERIGLSPIIFNENFDLQEKEPGQVIPFNKKVS